jgi:hypothetical protein
MQTNFRKRVLRTTSHQPSPISVRWICVSVYIDSISNMSYRYLVFSILFGMILDSYGNTAQLKVDW